MTLGTAVAKRCAVLHAARVAPRGAAAVAVAKDTLPSMPVEPIVPHPAEGASFGAARLPAHGRSHRRRPARGAGGRAGRARTFDLRIRASR